MGPNPTDRARCGSKLNVTADGAGTPISVMVSAANEHDVNFILPLIFTRFPSIGGAIGHPRTQPQSICADAGYTSKKMYLEYWPKRTLVPKFRNAVLILQKDSGNDAGPSSEPSPGSSSFAELVFDEIAKCKSMRHSSKWHAL